jgi:hypothetical protein
LVEPFATPALTLATPAANTRGNMIVMETYMIIRLIKEMADAAMHFF